MRGHTRKIALLDRYDTKLQCGAVPRRVQLQPGHRPDHRPADRHGRPAHQPFPVQGRDQIAKHYTDLKFRDFRHGITGALLWKAQHPDTETYYNSKHQKAGVECHQCHMPKMKDTKTGQDLYLALADQPAATTSRRPA